MWRRLNESVFDKLGSEITLEPSLTVKSIDRYPWGSLRSYSRVRSWASVISAGNGWPRQQWHQVREENSDWVILIYKSRCYSLLAPQMPSRLNIIWLQIKALILPFVLLGKGAPSVWNQSSKRSMPTFPKTALCWEYKHLAHLKNGWGCNLMCILSRYWLSLSIKHHLCITLELWGHRDVCDQKVKWVLLKKVENKETGNSFPGLLISNLATVSGQQNSAENKQKQKGTARTTFLHSNTDLKYTCNTVQINYSNFDFGHFVGCRYVLFWN